MLEDLRAMRIRSKEFILTMDYINSLAIRARELNYEISDFISDINELLTSEESYQRG